MNRVLSTFMLIIGSLLLVKVKLYESQLCGTVILNSIDYFGNDIGGKRA